MKKKIGSIFLIALFSGTSVFAQTKAEVKQTLVAIGMPVPVFKYEQEKGKLVKSSDLKGKVVLINFFATWCGPCKVELPKIQSEIWEKHQANPKFVMLTFGREHSWKEVNDFRINNKFPFPLYPDPTRGVYGLFATQLIPRSFLIDEAGKIIFMTEGFEEENFTKLVKLIDSKL